MADLSGLTFKLTSYQDEARQQVKEQIPLTKDYQAELEPGFYGVQEKTAPTGYALENSEYYFTIDSTGAVKGADSSAIATWSDGYLTQSPGSADTLYQSADQLYFQKFDQKQKQAKEFNLQLLKYDKSTKKQVSDLSGLSFQLTQYQAGEHKQVIEQQMITGNQISDFTIKLNPGYDYTIKEVTAPDGYELSNSNFDFKITEDGQLSSEKSVGYHSGIHLLRQKQKRIKIFYIKMASNCITKSLIKK
nr:prealbumin-like fold domain-containing protein [Enterococcus durans]